jgi:hypothetical protein
MERQTATRQAAHHCSDGNSEHVSRLPVTQAVDAHEDKHRTLIVGKLG